MLSNAQLRQIMRYHLDHFNSTSEEVTDDTVHDDILSVEGLGSANPARLYQGFVRFSLKTAGNPLKKWPDDWLSTTVADVADAIGPASVPRGLVRARHARSITDKPTAARKAPLWYKRMVLARKRS